MMEPASQEKPGLSKSSLTKTTLLEQEPLMNILSEYEDVNKGLTSLVELYEREHSSLRTEAVSLVEENSRLADELNEALKSAQQSSDEEIITNLQKQLALETQAKEAALESWKLAVGEVSNLETVLKIFQENKDATYSNQSMNARLEKARALTLAESQLVEARSQLARDRIARAELDSALAREREAVRSINEQLELATNQLERLEMEQGAMLESERRDAQGVDALVRARDDLQNALEQSQSRLKQANMQAEEARQRVAEALGLVDTACLSRDQAIAGELRAKEEAIRLQQALQELTDDATNRVKKEVEQVKQQCNSRIQTIVVDMKKLQEEYTEQKALAERALRAQKQAEEVVERKNQDLRAASSRHNPLEGKLQAMYGQLSDLERRAFRAESQQESIQQELAEERERRRRDLANHEAEKKVLEQQVSTVAHELEESRQKAIEAAREMGLREHHLATRVEAIEKNSLATVSELHQIVNAHQNMSEKCKLEMKAMAEKFSNRVKELRTEVMRLRKERDDACKELHSLKMRNAARSGFQPGDAKGRPKSLFLDC